MRLPARNLRGSNAIWCVTMLLTFVVAACDGGPDEEVTGTASTAAGCADELRAIHERSDPLTSDTARILVLEQGLQGLDPKGTLPCRRELLLELADLHERTGNTERLINVCDTLLGEDFRLSPEQAAGVRIKLAKACFSFGLPRSFELAKDVFRYYQETHVRSDRMLDATALLVSTYELTNENAECTNMLNDALKMAEAEGDIRWTCDLLDKLGGIASREGRGKDAARFHERSLAELARFFRSGAVRDTMVRLTAGGPNRASGGKTNDLGSTIEVWLTQTHYLTMRHRALKMLGDAQAVDGNATVAAITYQQAIDLAESSFIHDLVPPYTELGEIRLAQGNASEAARLGELARERAIRDHDAARAMPAADLLHRAYRRLNDTGRALAMLELARAYDDSLNNFAFRVGLVKQQVSYAARADRLNQELIIRDRDRQMIVERDRARASRNWTWGVGTVGVLLLLASALWYRSDSKRRMERFEKDAAVLETQALRSQMNPHFIFNALNSINAFVQGNDPDMASSYLSKFARVMRLVLENSRHAEVPLESDLEALRGYLDLERKRMRDKFDYSIDIDPAIDPAEVMVPPLVVQPFVENAIWHGMAGKDGQGHITLRIQQKGEQLLWVIEDDGIGRDAHRAIKDAQAGASSQFKEAAMPMKKTSLGTAITRARLDLVQKQYGGKAGWNYVDTPTGTRVEVDMPMRIGS